MFPFALGQERAEARPLTRSWLLLTLASLCVTAAFPLVGKTPLGDLSAHYSDHVRQSYTAWLFLHHGLDMYRLPLREAAVGIEYRQALQVWLDVPYVYPPGTFLLYLPLACVGQWVPLSRHAFGQLSILYLLGLTHLAFLLVLRMLERQPPGGRVLIGGLAWLVLMRLALQGQYDGVWLGFGALAIQRLGERRPARALGWVALAALLHYRAIILAPLGLVALLQAVRGVPWRRWPWATLGFVALVGATCVGTFLMMAQGAADGGAATPPLLSEPPGTSVWVVVLATAVAGALAWKGADLLVAGSVVLGGVLAFVDTLHWWHASMLLLVPLAVGEWRPPRWPRLVRVALVGWYTLLQMYAWGGNPLWLFKDVGRWWRGPDRSGELSLHPPPRPGTERGADPSQAPPATFLASEGRSSCPRSARRETDFPSTRAG
jgi:hypothetical protein